LPQKTPLSSIGAYTGIPIDEIGQFTQKIMICGYYNSKNKELGGCFDLYVEKLDAPLLKQHYSVNKAQGLEF
jgi:hypothetical protein